MKKSLTKTSQSSRRTSPLYLNSENIFRTAPAKSTPNSLPSDLLSIGNAAAFLGVSIDSLRRWEKRGLVAPQKTPGGTRYYSLERLKSLKSKTKGKLHVSKLLPLNQSQPVAGAQKISQLSGDLSSSLSYAKSPIEKAIKPFDAQALREIYANANNSDFTDTLSTAQKFKNSAVQLPIAEIIKVKKVLTITTLTSLVLFATIAAGYLTIPEQMIRLAQTSPILKPINNLGLQYLKLAAPQKANEIVALDKPLTKKIDGSRVLAATNIKEGVLNINTDTEINGTLTIQGDVALTGKNARGIIQSLKAGSNVVVDNTNPSNPTISVSLPANLVNTIGKKSGDITLGTGLAISDAKALSVNSTLSDIRSNGGCSSCITSSDVATNLTISSSGSVDTAALSGTVPTSKGGTGISTYTAGDILYANSSGVLTKLPVGTSGQSLVVTGGLPAWGSSAGGVTSLDSLTGALTIANTTGTGSTITIDNASTTVKGIASYTSSDFTTSSGAVSLATTGVTAATYGGSSTVPTITVDAKGRITSASSTTISIGSSNCSNCLFNNPSSTQTITPTSTSAIGLSVAQASSGIVDIFNVTNNDGTTKYLTVNSLGNVSLSGTLGVTGAVTLSSTLNTNTFTSTALTFAGTTPVISPSTAGTSITLNSGTTTGSVILNGGAGSSGCTIDSSGNFTCKGSITGATSGSQGYWSRTGTTLSPTNSGDAITTTGNISSTGTGTITSGGLITAQNGLTLSTGALNLTATSGTLTLSGLSASSISAGSNSLTFTSSNFNTTSTGINNTAIGATTASTGAFTTLSSTSGTNLATSTGNVGIGTASPTQPFQVNGNTAGSNTNSSLDYNTSSNYTQQDSTNGTQFTNGVVQLKASTTFNAGTGADGALSVTSGTTTINTVTTTGSTTGSTAGTTTVKVASSASFAVNDLIVIIQMKHSTAANVGLYDRTTISAIPDANTITVNNSLVNSYSQTTNSRCNASDTACYQVVKLPQYTTVSISSGATLTASAWSTTTGTGGILWFDASSTVSNSGTITMSGNGYAGGGGGGGGTAGAAGNVGSNGGTGSSGSAGDGVGGGGGGTAAGGGGQGASGNNGCGGYGGGGAGGTSGGGGGGGNSAAGGGGSNGVSGAGGGGGGSNGGAGGTGATGTGGTAGSQVASSLTVTSRVLMGSGGAGGAGGSGGGGSCYGSTNGNAGGAGGSGGGGGAGGGIVVVTSGSTLTNSGTINVSGTNAGTAGNGGAGVSGAGSGGGGGAGGSGGGGGAGGTVWLDSTSAITAGTLTISGGSSSSGGNGGGGGNAGGGGYTGGGGGAGATGGSGGTSTTQTAGGAGANAAPGSGGAGASGFSNTTSNSGTTTYPTTAYYVSTATGSQINTSTWTAITGISFTETKPTNTTLKYLVSFDSRSTWKYWTGSAWATSTLANIEINGNTSTTLNSLTSSNWASTGGFVAGTFDITVSLHTTNNLVTPNLDQITITYSTPAQSLAVSSGGNTIIGSAALSTTATDGFLYLTSTAGTPTGTPTGYTGRSPIIFDSTNNKLCAYNSAWKCSAALSDYAEWAPAKGVESGDVVTITTQKNPVDDPVSPFMLGKTTQAFDQKLLGVVSKYAEDSNSANGYKRSSDYHAIALAGRVPVKISTESGAIKAGDYLTSSSTPGVAMKATHAGQTLGKALEDYDGTQIGGTVLAIIQPGFADPGSVLASLTLDDQGNLVVPNLKVGNLSFDSALSSLFESNGQLNLQSSNPSSQLSQLQLSANSFQGMLNRINGLDTQQASQSAKLAQIDSQIASLSAQINNTATPSLSTESSKISDLETRIQALEAKLSLNTTPNSSQPTSEASLSALLSQQLTPPSDLLATQDALLKDLKVQSSATFSGQLQAYSATISDTFKSLGKTLLADTTIAGALTVGGTLTVTDNSISSIGTLKLQSGLMSDKLEIFDGIITMDKTGSIQITGSITASKYIINISDPNNVSLGSNTILAGQTSVQVATKAVTSNSKILLTPTTSTGKQSLVVLQKLSGEGFVVSIDTAISTNINFDWMIIDTTPESLPQ